MRLFDTLRRQVAELEPSGRDGTLTMYSCGPTVYREAHIGNLRTFLTADLIARTFRYTGTEVRQVQNITDVGHMTDEVFGEGGEDRMQLASEMQGLPAEQIAERYTQLFMQDIAAIGIEPAAEYPRASDHVPSMVELIAKLIERGHAYEIDGTVFYDTTSFPGYGRLSGNSLDALEADHRKIIGDDRKKHPSDFVLWMAAGPARQVVFESPWGKGYPGWHIECSAMSLATLGERIDLHTGGEDNVFPHHEDEIAQSEGAVGHQVVGHWVHSAHLLADGHKMSKSTGNDFTLRDLAARGHEDPLALRLLFLQSRYRGQSNFTFEALEAAARSLNRLRRGAERWQRSASTRNEEHLAAVEERFVSRMLDDLDTPGALRILHEVHGSSDLSDADKLALFERWDSILGLGLVPGSDVETPAEVSELVERRQRARAAKDFAESDRLRESIRQLGFEVTDTADGPEVRRI